MQEMLSLSKVLRDKPLLLAGGPPCQPFSGLGSQRGLLDNRSDPLVKFVIDAVTLKDECVTAGFRFEFMLEEVASLQPEIRQMVQVAALVHATTQVGLAGMSCHWTLRIR